MSYYNNYLIKLNNEALGLILPRNKFGGFFIGLFLLYNACPVACWRQESKLKGLEFQT